MMSSWRHPGLRRHSRSITLVALLDVVLVGECLLRVHGHVGHVVAGHVWVLRHPRSAALRRDVLTGRIFGRLDLVATVDAVFVSGRGLGSV